VSCSSILHFKAPRKALIAILLLGNINESSWRLLVSYKK